MNVQDASVEFIGGALLIWLMIAFATAIARIVDVEKDVSGSVAAGVLWPIYLPYRLIGMMRDHTA